MVNRNGGDGVGSTLKSESGRPAKPRVLLAMGFQNPQRQAGIVRYARRAGWIVDSRLLAYHAQGQDREYLSNARVDGVLALCSRAAPWIVDLVKQFKVPIVDMWSDYPQEPFPRVLLDHPTIGRAGAEYLLARGFRNLLFYTQAIEGKGGVARREAFKQAVASAGANFHALTWVHTSPPPGAPSPITWLAEWLSKAPLPLAVMGSNDFMANEALEAAALAGLRVPAQVAVLGVDNDPLVTELVEVPLSSIDSARERVGYEAAALLDRMMHGEPAPTQPMLIPPSRIVTRLSTDVLAVDDPEVADAMRFILVNFRRGISVDDVAAQANVSRRHLQDRFLKKTGRTIVEMIALQRIDRAKELLSETNAKIHVVAQQSGFSTGERMSKVFRRMVGLTPQQFRISYSRIEEPQETTG
jgi:LacI family transcriptional regulator